MDATPVMDEVVVAEPVNLRATIFVGNVVEVYDVMQAPRMQR